MESVLRASSGSKKEASGSDTLPRGLDHQRASLDSAQ